MNNGKVVVDGYYDFSVFFLLLKTALCLKSLVKSRVFMLQSTIIKWYLYFLLQPKYIATDNSTVWGDYASDSCQLQI